MGPIFVVRHATAGRKKHWHGDDDLRPLDALGRRQAEAVADLLAPLGPGRLRSSPSFRCTQTLLPLAQRLGRDVETEDELRPEAPAGSLLDLLARTGRPGDVVCTHGELLRPARRALRRQGAVPAGVDDDELLAKGGVWELDLAAPSLTLLHPPAA